MIKKKRWEWVVGYSASEVILNQLDFTSSLVIIPVDQFEGKSKKQLARTNRFKFVPKYHPPRRTRAQVFRPNNVSFKKRRGEFE